MYKSPLSTYHSLLLSPSLSLYPLLIFFVEKYIFKTYVIIYVIGFRHCYDTKSSSQ
jgi:hypothetical protein